MASLAIRLADKDSGSTNEPEEKTVSVAASSGTAALSADETTAADKSITLQLTAGKGPGTAGTPGGASVIVLPPEPVHYIHAVHGLDVR
jgi:hypothetical protein